LTMLRRESTRLELSSAFAAGAGGCGTTAAGLAYMSPDVSKSARAATVDGQLERTRVHVLEMAIEEHLRQALAAASVPATLTLRVDYAGARRDASFRLPPMETSVAPRRDRCSRRHPSLPPLHLHARSVSCESPCVAARAPRVKRMTKSLRRTCCRRHFASKRSSGCTNMDGRHKRRLEDISGASVASFGRA
jgi:hypothetical protein